MYSFEGREKLRVATEYVAERDKMWEFPGGSKPELVSS